MPVLNEAKNLYSTLIHLSLSDHEELIVVDGGSKDNTMEIAREFTAHVYQAKTGRASVMNFGAAKAEGDILLFLHADCLLPENAFALVRDTMSDTGIAAGAFQLSIDHPGWYLRLTEFLANNRAKLTSLIYGDQAMFLTKNLFDTIVGFADIPLMEDIEISQRLKSHGRIVFLKPPVKASPRRWIQEGALYTTLRDWSIAFLYTFLKVSPDKLIRHYRDVR